MQQHDGPLARLRRGHEELVLDLLRRHGPLSRAELGARCGLSRTTLYDIVGVLVATGTVVASVPEAGRRRRGRPVERLALNPAAGQAIGIDLARRAVHIAAVNVAHEVVGTASRAHGPDLDLAGRIALVEEMVDELSGDSLRLAALRAIGVGVVGPVASAPAPGSGGGSASLGAGDERDTIAELLRKRFGAPVLVDNNTRLAALAESVWGAATDARDVLYVRLSHGVGGGLVVDGALHRGASGLSGEFGHISVEPGGRRCQCGGSGCLETVASAGAVLDAYRAAGGTADDIAAVTAAARAGEPAAVTAVAAAGRRVGVALAAVCNAIGPSTVVVGGELASAGAVLIDQVRAALTEGLMPVARPLLDLRPAVLGEGGAALGGIALVLHRSPLLSRYPNREDREDGDVS
ncbi:ROK family protein [Actinacidiphila paucisporea]|uniref:Sugar kinase of the NBD/HSP70 family, may contain an N-terminal HTH domain n=1 Tax=Actinacidiphila paucisporea TaxID=310782 RepID=A0A1M7PES1_9ACTN|nr:ROK family protein [Actinacidiphila paucisporea]SHN15487.1 Sugar kinase of the NBD/HSP70 family, may contain an N-terminal HTH domain [Actinacidiphila paucisporea]